MLKWSCIIHWHELKNSGEKKSGTVYAYKESTFIRGFRWMRSVWPEIDLGWTANPCQMHKFIYNICKRGIEQTNKNSPVYITSMAEQFKKLHSIFFVYIIFNAFTPLTISIHLWSNHFRQMLILVLSFHKAKISKNKNTVCPINWCKLTTKWLNRKTKI